MKLREKREQWGNGKRYVGRKNNYKVTVSYAPSDFTGKKDYWYFSLNKEDYSYNSLWDNLHYKTQDECVEAAEKKIGELVKGSN